jgi:glutamyl-tRNA synthetase
MRQMTDVLETITDWNVEGLKAVIDPWAEQAGIKPWNAWRIALVGAGQGPDMYELAAFLGKEETIRRTRKAIEVLG